MECKCKRQYLCSTFAKRGGPEAAVGERSSLKEIEEASVVQEKKRERSQFSQVTLRRYKKIRIKRYNEEFDPGSG